MITSVVGRTFLQAYNKKYNCSKTPREFFEEVYFELFYNHSKYMQWVTNSPFTQMKGGQKAHLLSVQERQEKLNELHNKILTLKPDGSFALGFPAAENEEYASTSGLVSDVGIPANADEIYLSWIGSGLGVGVSGGYTILYNDANITLQTFEGWKHYRNYLEDPTLEHLRGNQINTWNGQWLSYSLDAERFNAHFDFSELSNEGVFDVGTSLAEVNTVKWTNLFFSLSKLYPDKEIVGYIYGFGQTNKTVGFIPFSLKSGDRIKEVYSKLFGGIPIDKRKFEALFGIHIKRACELGSIGIQALRPEGLRKYIFDEKNLSIKKEDDLINYYAYKTWLMAMLTRNKEEIRDYTFQIAEVMLRYRNGSKGTERTNLINKELFAAKHPRAFVNALITVMNGIDADDVDFIKQLKDDIHLMSIEEFGYFVTLIKFDYAFHERKIIK